MAFRCLILAVALVNGQLPWRTTTTVAAPIVTTVADPLSNGTISGDETVDVTKPCTNDHIDLTMMPGSWGEDVARSTYSIVMDRLHSYNNKIEDRGFFMRFAYAETKYGEITFDHLKVQQIWSISEEQFMRTKEFFMTTHVLAINHIFGVNWMTLRYQELNVPVYSCIAFYMYLEVLEAFPLPWSVDGQGYVYETIADKPLIQWTTYMTDLTEIETETCKNEATDLVFLVDQSGSIGEDNFKLMTEFVTSVIGSLNVAQDNTRIGVRTYSIQSESHIALENFNNDLVAESAQIGYDCADRSTCLTYTNVGIRDVLDIDFTEASGMRVASKKILVVITDGQSTIPILTQFQANRLRLDEKNIQVIAIGVKGANATELELIATSPEQVYFLENFSDFVDVREQISSSICTAPIVGGNGNNLVAIVAQGTSINGISGMSPGFVHFKLEMKSRTSLIVQSSAQVACYVSYTNSHPSPAAFDYTFDVTGALVNIPLTFNISEGVEFIYMSAYNYGNVASQISVDILTTTITNSPNEIPIPCGINAHCEGSKCFCNNGYSGNAYAACVYDLCNAVICGNSESCNSGTGMCECREGYAKVNGICIPPMCPTEPIIATENQFGYAMGHIESPFYGEDNYPHNFDCFYEVDAPRAEHSCYEIHIEAPFSLETSRSCKHDRLELFDIQNAGVITMDHEATALSAGTTAVLCGNACIADGGWIGRSCGNKLRFRFKSDDMITSTGWRIKWILRPEEECACWCNL